MINDKLHKLRIYQAEIEDAKLIKTTNKDDPTANGKSGSFISRVSVGFWNYLSGSTPRHTPDKNFKMKADKKMNGGEKGEKKKKYGKVSVIRLSISSDQN